MAKDVAAWRVLRNGPIDELSERVWRVEGQVPRMPLRRVMTLVKRGDGRLVVHNGIALGEEEMARVEAFGEPAFLIVPNSGHRMDAPAFVRRYPNLKVLCPRKARARVEKVVRVDGDYDDYPQDAHSELRHLSGTGDREGVLEVRDDSGTTLVFNDLIFNLPHQRGLSGFLLKWVTASSGGPRISKLSRLMLCDDASKLADELRAMNTPELKRIIVSHYEVITREPGPTLVRLAASLG